MDFTGRSQASQPHAPNQQFVAGNGSTPAANNTPKRSSRGTNKQQNAMRWGAGVLGLLIVILVAAVILLIGLPHKTESSYVDKNRLQAVFLNTGQVYFGNIDTLNSKFFVLNNIYYLQTSSTGANATSATSASNTSVSLVKLGCELHSPYDQMVINRDQVTFWENLQTNGQVAKAVANFQKANPNGQKCSDQSTSPNSGTNVQGGTSTPSSTTTPTTSTTPTTTTTTPTTTKH